MDYPLAITPPAVTVFIVRKDTKQYLLIRRCSKYLAGNWQMVSGTTEENEVATQTALRELKEETGLVPLEVYIVDMVETFYEARSNRIMTLPVFVAFINGDEKITLSPHEHDAYEWLDLQATEKKLDFENQRALLRYVEKQYVRGTPNPILKIKL